jgi:hypothetical protein
LSLNPGAKRCVAAGIYAGARGDRSPVDSGAHHAGAADAKCRARGANPLGRLIDAINATERRTREVEAPHSTLSPWTVLELRVRTLQVAGE